MKGFILGFIVALILGAWVTLAIVGVISLKIAIIVPVCLICGFIIAAWVFALLFSF